MSRVLVHVYLVLAEQVPLEVALEVGFVVADGAVKIGRLAARHFLVET